MGTERYGYRLNKYFPFSRLKEHLNKLLGLLKSLTLSTSTRVALWQPPTGPEGESAALMQQIIQVLWTFLQSTLKLMYQYGVRLGQYSSPVI